jgi:ATP adenylyltransferase
LYVADASPTHVCLLNKFNVVEYHLLIVTRAFEEQETCLSQRDFEALWTCLAEFEGLGFYNSGALAGASQPHKHLQLVPLPWDPDGPRLPLASVIDSAVISAAASRLETLPFPHAVAALRAGVGADPNAAAAEACDQYRRLLPAIGIPLPAAGQRLAAAYNLLMTRQWMLAVPRVCEGFQSISCNALAFAGALLVRDELQLGLLQQLGPLAILRHVTGEQ